MRRVQNPSESSPPQGPPTFPLTPLVASFSLTFSRRLIVDDLRSCLSGAHVDDLTTLKRNIENLQISPDAFLEALESFEKPAPAAAK